MSDDDMGKIIEFPMHKLEKNKLNDDTYVRSNRRQVQRSFI